MKSPPEQYTDDVCHAKVVAFIEANSALVTATA